MNPFSIAIFFDEKKKAEITELLNWSNAILYKIEFQLIKDGYRKCNFLHIDPMNPESMRIIVENNFKYRVLEQVRRYSGFAHKHYKPRNMQEALLFAAVCIDDKSLDKFSKAYMRGDHKTIGLMLGYPKCDVKFFVKHWGKHLDLIYPSAMNSKRSGDIVYFDPRLNIMLRYVGARIIPHFPCNFQCRKAIEFAEIILEYLRKDNPTYTSKLLELLSKPLIFSQVNGIIQSEVFEDEAFKDPLMVVIQSGYSTDTFRLKMVPG